MKEEGKKGMMRGQKEMTGGSNYEGRKISNRKQRKKGSEGGKIINQRQWRGSEIKEWLLKERRRYTRTEGANKITVSYWRRQGRNGGNSVGKTDPALSLYRAALWERNPRHICQSQTSQTTTGKNTGTLTQLLTVSPDRPQQLLSDRHTHTHTHSKENNPSYQQLLSETTARIGQNNHQDHTCPSSSSSSGRLPRHITEDCGVAAATNPPPEPPRQSAVRTFTSLSHIHVLKYDVYGSNCGIYSLFVILFHPLLGKILENVTTDLSDKQRVYSGLPVGWFRQIFILLSSAGHTLFSGRARYPSMCCFLAVLMVMLVHWWAFVIHISCCLLLFMLHFILQNQLPFGDEWSWT